MTRVGLPLPAGSPQIDVNSSALILLSPSPHFNTAVGVTVVQQVYCTDVSHLLWMNTLGVGSISSVRVAT